MGETERKVEDIAKYLCLKNKKPMAFMELYFREAYDILFFEDKEKLKMIEVEIEKIKKGNYGKRIKKSASRL